MSLPSVEQRLQRHEAEIKRIQEVLLFRRPLVLVLVLVGIAAFSGFVRSYECGIFATLSLIPLVYYGIVIVWTYLGQRFDAWLFPALDNLAPDNLGASNRVRSAKEISNFIAAVYGILTGSLNASIRDLVLGVLSILLAAILWTVPVFWLHIVLALVVLFLPGLLLLSPVYALWHPLFEKIAGKSEKKKKD
jgi:hypothetical protein